MGKSSAESIRILESHFESDGWPLDVNKRKLWDRYQIASDEAWPGWDVVEIERHRPILGDVYVQGLPMSAYETYYMRYAVQISNADVRELSERHGGIEIDTDGLVETDLGFERFSLSIKAIDENSYRISEEVSNETAVISTLDEAKTFVLTLLGGFVDYFSESLERDSDILGDDGIDKTQMDALHSTYKARMKEALCERAEKLWKERDEYLQFS